MPQASLPNPRTWSPGDLVTVPRLRADVADTVAFLTQRPWFAGQNTGSNNIASGSDVALGLNVQLTDPWNGWVPNPGGFSAIYWAQVPGWYLAMSSPAWLYTTATGSVFCGGIGGTTSGVAFGPNRAAFLQSGLAAPPTPQCFDLVEQVNTGPANGSGDFIQFTCFQNTGSPQPLAAGTGFQPSAMCKWVSAISGTQPLPAPPGTSVPSPVTAAWLNADVRDTIRFLVYPPIVKAFYTAGSSTLASSAFPAGSVIPLTTVTVDNYGGYTTGAAAKYTAPVSGRYFLFGTFTLAAASAGYTASAGLSVNGGTIQWGTRLQQVTAAQAGGAWVVKRLRLAAGDTVQLMGCQTSGAAVAYNATPANQTRFIAVWEGK